MATETLAYRASGQVWQTSMADRVEIIRLAQYMHCGLAGHELMSIHATKETIHCMQYVDTGNW